MQALCPGCEKETEIEVVEGGQQFVIRGETIEVATRFGRCRECGVEFETTRGDDALAEAYRQYRRQHHMLQPEEIAAWRKQLGLLQKELAALLGWGGATVNRYENGALQDEAHERMLRLTMDRHNLLKLVNDNPDALSSKKRELLMARLLTDAEGEAPIDRLIVERLGGYPADELSGFKKFDIAKFCNAVLFFCKGGQLKTKLNKLLFYADFKHFKEYSVSITGARYIHLPHGPVLDNYEYLFAGLIHSGEVEVDEVVRFQYQGENVTSAREPDLPLFEVGELKILAEVKEFFHNFTATQIRDFSHGERGYRETSNRQAISFLFAEELKI